MREHQVVVLAISSWEDILVNATSQASANEHLHIPNNGEDPKKVLSMTSGCLDMIDMIK